MIYELPIVWLVIANIVGWFAVHMIIAYGITILPVALFNPDAWLYKKRRWEGETLYRTVFKAHRWKKKLPDGAALFKKGFAKKSLKSREPVYLKRFVKETCRGELSHWLMMVCVPLFFLFNPAWAWSIHILYGLTANLPCIITQRYNRIYFQSLLSDQAERSSR